MPRDQGRGRGRGAGRGTGRGGGRGRNGGRGGVGGRGGQERQQGTQNDSDPQFSEMNPNLPERIRGPHRTPLDQVDSHIGTLKVKLNPDIRKYVHQQANITADAEEGHWLKRPEIPANEEIGDEPQAYDILPNKQRGKWKTKEKYLRVQFELLRDDAVGPLQVAVETFCQDPYMMDTPKMAIYEKVHIVGFTYSHAGIATRIQFSTYRAQRRILWSGSKRLVSGGLVALSPADDKFQKKCIVAVVAARPLEGVQQNPPEIDLFFARTEDLEIDPQQEWIMVEAKTGYYEAYRHTLQALQKMSKEAFPLASHICSLSPDIEPPAYLTRNPTMDLSPAGAEGADHDYTQIDVINSWPECAKSTLDETQLEALHRILTKSLAIVQGPPGTGKTFVSGVALEILNSYVKDTDPPIIIAAQTNHALDQLLGHVSKFEPNFIRLGGQSTNIEVKKRSLWRVRRNERINLVPGSLLGQATSRNHAQSKSLRAILEPLTQDPVTPLSLDTFVKHGIISEKQSGSLSAGASRWVCADGSENEPLELWMGSALFKFVVEYETEDFGFDEEDEDLELEQLREQEAENGINDEEDAQDMLQGTWCAVSDQFTVDPPSETDMEEASRLLDTTNDLWKVPHAMRGAIYDLMKRRLKSKLLKEFREEAEAYQRNIKDLKVGKWERDACFLERARIIGVTCTGLSKYRPLLSALRPKIVLIEEAAEVLEAPVSIACMESVEHVILIGDHEQLQAHCSDPMLAGYPYYLDVSLFERLVKNEVPYSTLLRQRRMDPLFRKLLFPIYPALQDHPSVLKRPKIDCGMGDLKHFFFDHAWLESRDAQMSTFNGEEARFIAGFYRHLLLNGVPPAKVTILTFYNGQRKRLLKEIRAYPELKQVYNNVRTVDGFQGEENSFVLLSLARHNYEGKKGTGKIGFLENRNRVCVALSRAQQGFYIFGSTETLKDDSLWANVIQQMESTGCLGPHLPIICKKHGNRKTIDIPDQWKEGLGGCDLTCAEIMKCGHACERKCHSFGHELVMCMSPCEKPLICGHPCVATCSQPCSCSCAVFQRAHPQQEPHATYSSSDVRAEDESSLEPRSMGTSEHDGWMDGKFTSGETDLIDESFIYLPDQLSRLPRSRPTDGTAMGPRSGTIHRGMLPPTQTGSTQEFNGKPGSSRVTFGSYDTPPSPFAASRYSDEEQAASRNMWLGYANGGVKDDDERLVSSLENSPVKGIPTPLSRGNIARGNQMQQLGRGRNRYTQQYRPAGARVDGGTDEEGSPKKSGGNVKFGVLIDI